MFNLKLQKMKKMFFSFSVAAMALLATSCSNDQVQSGTPSSEDAAQTEEVQRLQQSIEALSDSLALERTSMVGTREILQEDASGNIEKLKPGSFWKWLKIAFSDALGAFEGYAGGGVVGAVIGGVSASITAYDAEGNVVSDDNGYVGKSSKLPLEGLVVAKGTTTKIDSVGYFHNGVINDASAALVKGCSSDVFNASITSATNKVVYNGQNSVPTKYIATDQIQNKIKSDVAELLTTKDVDEYCNKLIRLNSNNWSAAKVLATYLKGLSYADHTSSEFSTKTWQMIESSSLSESNKAALKTGIVVANASTKLWEVK